MATPPGGTGGGTVAVNTSVTAAVYISALRLNSAASADGIARVSNPSAFPYFPAGFESFIDPLGSFTGGYFYSSTTLAYAGSGCGGGGSIDTTGGAARCGPGVLGGGGGHANASSAATGGSGIVGAGGGAAVSRTTGPAVSGAGGSGLVVIRLLFLRM